MSTTRRADKPRDRRLGTAGLVLFVVACVAPMAAVVSIVPLGMYLGNGAGFVGAIIIAGLILCCFAAGYVALSRHVINAGAFYAYIAKGLGKPIGVAGSFIAMLAYNAAFWSLAGAIGFFSATLFGSVGIHLPWQFWCAVALAAVAFLGRRAIDVSAKVLGVALILEVAVIVVLDVAVVAQRGIAAFPVQVLAPSAVFSGAIGLALLFAFNMFIGFEATAIFAEETRRPEKTVPRATYLSIGLIAVFFAVASLVLVGAVGPANLISAMDKDPGTFVFRLATHYVGDWLSVVMQILVLTSLFASLLGIHNAASRYFFSLGRERLLPARLGSLHPRWGSPAVASATQIILALVVVGAFGIANVNPLLTLDTSTTGLGTVGILLLQAAVAVAAIVYFRRLRDRRVWTTVVAPAIAALALTAVVVLALVNYPVLSGTDSVFVNSLPWIFPVLIAAGIGYGMWLRRKRPEIYAGIAEGARPETELGHVSEPVGTHTSRKENQ